MRKIKLAVAAAAVAAGVLAPILVTGTANAATTYSVSYINRCATVSGSQNKDCFHLGAYATYSQSQVWINGSVFCNVYSGNVTKTWCGVGGGNGTGALNIGVNFNMSGVKGLYERMNILAGGNVAYGGDGPGCSTWGSNSSKIQGYNIHWWNDDYGPYVPPLTDAGAVVCEYPGI
jgi:hypothetical protein